MLAALLALSLASAPQRYALVVTNNRSLNHERADLRYADDDGVAWAQLFDDLFGSHHAVLLTQLDEETSRLAPGLHGTPAPTLAGLREAVSKLAESVKAARARNEDVELFLVFAGHGDVDQGSGYLELLDGRLNAAALEEQVIKPLQQASRLNLIIDSCNSWFMLNPRKPGGRRWQAEGLPTGPLTARYPQLGAFISTNAEAESWEWSELQSGIFSYEARSGLRGAADADGDHRISYRELAAFIERANSDVPNAQYRPRIAWVAPNTQPDSTVLALRQGGRTLRSSGSSQRRFTVRDARGVRVADVHQEAGTAVALQLPESGELSVSTLVPGEERPVWTFATVPAPFDGELDSLATTSPPTAARGEAPVFGRLFAQPYGKQAFAQFVAQPAPTPVFGVTRDDVQRLQRTLGELVEDDREERVLLSGGARPLQVWEAVRVSEPSVLLRRLSAYDVSSDEARARAILVTERDFGAAADRARANRLGLGVSGIVVGLGLGVAGGVLGATQRTWGPTEFSLLGGGALVALASTIFVVNWQTAIERAWNSWRRNEVDVRAPQASVSLILTPGALGLRASF